MVKIRKDNAPGRENEPHSHRTLHSTWEEDQKPPNLGSRTFNCKKNQRAQVDDVTDEDEDLTSNTSGDEVIADIGTGLEHGFIVFKNYETDSDYDHNPEASDSNSEDTDSDF